MKKIFNFLSEFSVPLICGVVFAMVFANLDEQTYHHFINFPLLSKHIKIFGHTITFHFLMNDILMVLFFGIATVEIVQAVSPGGSLNPVKRAINPLMATLGGVLGPAGLFVILCHLLGRQDALNGWGIPTATDIALAWLVARFVFGSKHPAVSFLLLLAIADDAIGLAIIAVFYPDPSHPVQPIYLILVAGGMLLSFLLARMKIASIWPYILLGGGLSWTGLILSSLHPALALVFIIPFMPSKVMKHGQLFEDEKADHSSIVAFEHTFKLPVDFGLFGFGLANAGVAFSGVDSLTWIIFLSLAVGKLVGITLFSFASSLIGFPLPKGMNVRSLFVAALVAGLGLTVALFVAGEAYQNHALTSSAKMGAVFSAGIAAIALFLGKLFRIEKIN